MGSVGNSTKVATAPWWYVVDKFRKQIESSTELDINPDNGHAVFSANEAPITPVIEGFMGNLVGSDGQIKQYFQQKYPQKRINITRSKYL